MILFKKNISFSTPVVSQMHYPNGFNIITEPNRVILQMANFIPNDDYSKQLNILKDISLKYLKLLGHKYQDIGINFDIIADDLIYSVATHRIVQKDISHLKLDNNQGKVNGIDLSYHIKGKKFNISIKSVDKKQGENKKIACVPLFQVNVNYPGDYSENQATIIEEITENYKHLAEFIGNFYESRTI